MQTQGSYSENAPVKQSAGDPSSRPTFLIACWLLALLAFAQLITIGAALTSGRTVAAAPKAVSAPVSFNKLKPIEPRSVAKILESIGPLPPSTTPAAGSKLNNPRSNGASDHRRHCVRHCDYRDPLKVWF